ncbi:hypothetical protein J23TS9_52270 [Paenibacillus sp. J23TS9]|uniref:LysM peptidoglycan-binding domain-containing protein n=1 Tax=Paenibacillus sp. J23TS9 TaxID=2807193 RepID=UPI001B01924B|nr:LysM peptidoglycan-binding domain-containing protein [Paenibacillus sp. J23TS9]GIP30097.1 hypothetical protein J23TS9_52270 [Paenibacillus sp. J23TS9]
MKIHIVKNGDTLYELSKKYDIPLQKIIDANPQISDPNQLQIGQKVKIPAVPVQVPSNDQIIHKHVVKQGDSLWKLSKAWGVSLKEMIDANPQLKNPNALLVGEVVNIPKTSGNSNADTNSNANTIANANAHPDKVLPGGKAYTGPKEETAPKAEVTAPINVQPQQLEIPNLPLPNLMPEMSLPNVPNVMPNIPNIMPEMTVPNVMPNIMPEMVKPNVTPNIMPEMTMPNVMPNVMPNMTPNVMPEMTVPNVMPNIMPLAENKPMAVKPVHEEPCGCEDNYGGAQHPFMQFPVPAQEVGSFYNMPCDEGVLGEHSYNNMPYPGKTSNYPGIVESAQDDDCMPNQSWVSPYSHIPGGGQWGENHWENHQSPVAYEPNIQSPVSNQPNHAYHHNQVSPMFYEPNMQSPVSNQPNHAYHHNDVSPMFYEPNMQSPVSNQPNQPFHHNDVSPMFYEPNMQSPVSNQPNQPYHHSNVSPMYYEPAAYNPCGCSDVSPAYHGPNPNYVDPMFNYPGGCPQFVYPAWCYPYPAPMMGNYGAMPNAQLGAYGHDPNMQFHDPNMQFPGWGGMGHPEWDRAQSYGYPEQMTQPEPVSAASVNSAQASSTSFEAAESNEEVKVESTKQVKTLSSTKNSAKATREKAAPQKSKKQGSSLKRKNPWIKG